MGKIFLTLLIICIFALSPQIAFAVTTTPTQPPTPTPTKSPSPLDQQINDLKDRIASRVAQLKLVEKRGIMGSVTDVSNTEITLSDVEGNTRFVDVDELTKFASPSAKGSFGISDITKGSRISVIGLYNKQSRRILARFVNVLLQTRVIHGASIGVNTKTFSMTVVTDTNQQFTVDIETTTKIFSYTKTDGLVKSGFSKLKDDQHIIVMGFPDPTDTTHITASRIYVFPDIPRNPKIQMAQPALQPDSAVTPSTGSGKKLTPIVK